MSNYETSKAKLKRYQAVKSFIDRIENGYNDYNGNFVPPNKNVLLYRKWLSLTPAEKFKCSALWDQYYKNVLKTRTFLIYKEISEAFKLNNKSRIRELKEETKALLAEQADGRLELGKPPCLNPHDFLPHADVSKYLTAKREFESLHKESLQAENLSGIF